MVCSNSERDLYNHLGCSSFSFSDIMISSAVFLDTEDTKHLCNELDGGHLEHSSHWWCWKLLPKVSRERLGRGTRGLGVREALADNTTAGDSYGALATMSSLDK